MKRDESKYDAYLSIQKNHIGTHFMLHLATIRSRKNGNKSRQIHVRLVTFTISPQYKWQHILIRITFQVSQNQLTMRERN